MSFACRGHRGGSRHRAAGAAATGLGAAEQLQCLWLRIELGNDFAGDDGLAVAFDDLDDHAGAGRRQFKDHLVGFDVDQVLIAGDGIALLDMPFG